MRLTKSLSVKAKEHVAIGKHHTSTCYKSVEQEPSVVGSYQKQPAVTTRKQDVIYPVVVILVDGIKCRAPLDTGAGRSYVPSELARRLEKKPLRTDHKQRDNALYNSHTFKDLVRSASNQCLR